MAEPNELSSDSAQSRDRLEMLEKTLEVIQRDYATLKIRNTAQMRELRQLKAVNEALRAALHGRGDLVPRRGRRVRVKFRSNEVPL
jgi:GAF domain-containing protein